MLRYAADYGSAATEGTEYAPKWDSLIEPSHGLLSDSQCDETGLVVSDCDTHTWRGEERHGGVSGVQAPPRLVGGLLIGVRC